MLDTMRSYWHLYEAKKTIDAIVKHIGARAREVAEGEFNHDTTLITIGLIAPAALYHSLPKREQNQDGFEDYVRMMACGLFGGDLEDLVNDEPNSPENPTRIKVKDHFLSEARGIASQRGILAQFDAAVEESRTYQACEQRYSEKLRAKDYSFIAELFKEDPTLHKLTYGRLTVLYVFGLDAAFKMFLNGTSQEKYKPALNLWVKYLPTAMQEGYDDVNDLSQDAAEFKPTPIILRGIKALLDRGASAFGISEDVMRLGMAATRNQIAAYHKKCDELVLPPVVRVITTKAFGKLESMTATAV